LLQMPIPAAVKDALPKASPSVKISSLNLACLT